MSDERFDRLEKMIEQNQYMMEQLIKMVGSNNAVTEELRQDVSVLKQDVSVLKQDVSVLKQDVSVLKQDVSVLKQDVSVLKQDVSVLKQDVSVLKQDVSVLDSKLDRLALETQEDVKAMLQHIDKKTDLLEDKFDALNDRLFNQETQLQRLKKQAK
ncbi:hypothetical protein SCACP_39960 [Sporomusa carbonis]|uniref:hypothetical protein n=1 Tax=Sporomusa carbonis TaxID=3076075 RepID=UPI003A63B05A